MAISTSPLSNIRKLPNTLVDQIAAGEVVERPASVVKELIENAIDAGATSLELTFERGGKTLIDLKDNGHGMDKNDLVLAPDRHATSKLMGDDLLAIHYLGFRGEALASISAVSRLMIESRQSGADEAWLIRVSGGEKETPCPSDWQQGTHIQIRYLFYAVPARLKFLKADSTEKAALLDVVKRTALVHPDIAFRVHEGERKLLALRRRGTDTSAIQQRIFDLLGVDFRDNSVAFDAEREHFRLFGLASLPTRHKANSLGIHVFVNRRPLRDKNLISAVRAGYSDLIPSGRYPETVLFLEVAPDLVDVNVHPAKAEVRFQDAAHIRGLIVSALREALSGELRTASSIGHNLAKAFSTKIDPSHFGTQKQQALPINTRGLSGKIAQTGRQASASRSDLRQVYQAYYPALAQDDHTRGAEEVSADFAIEGQTEGEIKSKADSAEENTKTATSTEVKTPPLGLAKAQVHRAFIISETADGIVMIDQHAAHERLVYERFKKTVMEGTVERQLLLIPEIIDFDPAIQAVLIDAKEDLAKLGLCFEAFGAGAIAISEVPSLIRHADFKTLLGEIASDFSEHAGSDRLEERLNAVTSRMACHGSIRAGRDMAVPEMDQLLRDIESNPIASQCNHGRPTFIHLSLVDIEKLFGRR